MDSSPLLLTIGRTSLENSCYAEGSNMESRSNPQSPSQSPTSTDRRIESRESTPPDSLSSAQPASGIIEMRSPPAAAKSRCETPASASPEPSAAESAVPHLNHSVRPVFAADSHCLESQSTTRKRKRGRRSPVWLFFGCVDVEGIQMAACSMCSYRTKSAYSTNLKIHLKCHHKEAHAKVLEVEALVGIEKAFRMQNPNPSSSLLSDPNDSTEMPADGNEWLSAIGLAVDDDGNICAAAEPKQPKHGDAEEPLDEEIDVTSDYGDAVDSNGPTESAQNLQVLMEAIAGAANPQTADQMDMSALLSLSAFPTNYHLLAERQLNADPFFAATTAATAMPTSNTPPALGGPFSAATAALDDPMMNPLAKRKRLRRHPVWQYFGDLDEKNVGCKMCSFSTASAFSTNLKMHLKSHHKREFIIVMEQEVAQLVKEGASEKPSDSPPNSLEAPNGKRRRRTVHELRQDINKCKQSLERDVKNAQNGLGRGIAASLSPPDPAPTLQLENVFNVSPVSFVPTANATPSMAASPLKVESSPPPPPIAQLFSQQFPPQSTFAPLFAQFDGAAAPENVAPDTQMSFHTLIMGLQSVSKSHEGNELVGSLRRSLREAALNELIGRLGVAGEALVQTEAFQDFVYTLDPTFKIPALEH